MIDWIQSSDGALFQFINQRLSNPVFDKLMPLASTMPGFVPVIILVLALMICRGGARGRVCAAMLVLGLCVGDWVIADAIKHGVARLRPFNVFPNAHVLVGKSDSFSMPSSHALNWFSAAMITFIFYRRSIYFMLPLAVIVSFSRIYNGVHYPTDVLAGAVLGAGCAAGLVWSCNALWQRAGPRWFPIWHASLPSLINPVASPSQTEGRTVTLPSNAPSPSPPHTCGGEGRGEEASKYPKPLTTPSPSADNRQWLNLGYALIAILLLVNLAYLASGKIELSEDEAYQWIWSKHMALSYYSKPLLIACAQFVGTHMFGDTELGVRFLSPVIAAVLSFLVLRFMAREIGARAAFMVILILAVTPLTALGALLMTVDPLSVLFWTAAMIAGWRAVQEEGATSQWLWMGLWMGLGFLSKYTNLFEWLCWAVFFVLWPPARKHLRRPGPWLALLIAAVCSLPVLIWNSQHNWITVQHVASDGQLGQPWQRTFTLDFLLAEAGLLHPVFFIAAIWAAVAFWRNGGKDAGIFALPPTAPSPSPPQTCGGEGRGEEATPLVPPSSQGEGPARHTSMVALSSGTRKDPFALFLFSMGAPLFLFYFLLSLHSRVLPNWIAPSIVPLFCLMAVYWSSRWPAVQRVVRPILSFSIVIGIFAVLIMHNSNLVTKVIQRQLPPNLDPMRRVLGWKQLAQIVGQERSQQEALTGKPTFIIAGHYGFTSQITFYLPEAKSAVQSDPLVFFYATKDPINQFYFWPNYLDRKGQNAIFVREVERPKFRPGWFSAWWHHSGDLYLPNPQEAQDVPPELREQFTSVTDLGIKDVVYDGRGVMRRVQMFSCQNLK